MAQENHQSEIQHAMRREGWSLTGPNRIVKITALDAPMLTSVSGYVCLEKVLVGKTPSQIESMLGAKINTFIGGIRIFRLTRLPLRAEVEYELTTKFPDGLAYNPAMHDSDYPPGSPAIHQWRLLVNIPAQVILELKPNQTYPRNV